MKKSFFLGFIALATLTMMSCSNDETTAALYEDNAIEFGTYAGRTPMKAQGKETTTASIATEGFGVSAVYTGQSKFDAYQNPTPNFMYNQKVDKSTGSWAYSPVKYWPTTQNDKLSFFAYAPHANDNVTLTDDNANPKTLVYELDADPTKNHDFVAAAMYDKIGSLTPAEVKFFLVHELTRAAFQVKVDQDIYTTADDQHATKLVIRDVKLDFGTAKLYKKGTYTYANTDYASGSHGSWSFAQGDAFGADFTLNTLINGWGEVKLAGDKYTATGLALENKNPVALFATDDYLFLLPPNGTTGLAAEGDITATFTYDIVTEDDKLNVDHSCTSATKTVKLPASSLAQGKSYIYTFIFRVDEVVVSAEVEQWDEVSNIDNTVDYNDPV